MNILILNLILFTPDNGIIPKNNTIKDTMIHALCKGFLKNGHKVTLIASEDYRPTMQEDYDFNVIFMKSKAKNIFKPTLLPYPSDLFRYLKENADRYDMVISSECFSIATLMAVITLPEKLIIWQEQTAHQRKFFKLPSKLWYNIVGKVFFNRGEIIVGRSESAKKFTGNYLKNVAPDIIEHGVDDDKFQAYRKKEDYFVASSQLIKRKQVDYIITMFSRLLKNEKYCNYRLYIAGRGEEEYALKTLVSDLGINDNVVFTGYLSQVELNNLIGRSKGLLIASRRDLNMVSVPECIVSGTPLIMTSVPASSQYVRKHRLGIVKDNWSEKDMIELIENNQDYVDRCHAYRTKLLSTSTASLFVRLLTNNRAAEY